MLKLGQCFLDNIDFLITFLKNHFVTFDCSNIIDALCPVWIVECKTFLSKSHVELAIFFGHETFPRAKKMSWWLCIKA